MLYFLLSTLVLTLYIDVVLSLSMELWSASGTQQFNGKHHKEITNRIYGTGRAVNASVSFRGTWALMSKRSQ